MKHIFRFVLIILIFIAPLAAKQDYSVDTQFLKLQKKYSALLENLNTTLGYYISSYQTELIMNDIIDLMKKNNFYSVIVKDEEIKEFHNFIKINGRIYYNQSDKKIEKEKNTVLIKEDIFFENKKVGELFIYVEKDTKIPKLELSKEEKRWLESNPIIKLATMSYWPDNKNGLNFHKEVLKLINKYANINIIPITFDIWSEGYSKAVKGKDINGIMGLSYSKQREKEHFFYSPSYHFTPAYLITRKNDNEIKSINDLKGKTVYLKKDSITHKLAGEKLKETKIKDKKNRTGDVPGYETQKRG